MVNKNSAIKNTGDHNWDMERMQVEKDKGNILTDKDYVKRNLKMLMLQLDYRKTITVITKE
jgi:hypothetical protein